MGEVRSSSHKKRSYGVQQEKEGADTIKAKVNIEV